MASRTFALNKAIFNPTLYDSIRKTWFEGIPPGSVIPPESAIGRWFGLVSPDKKQEFDSACHSTVQHALEAIGPDAYPLPPPPKDFAEDVRLAPEIARPFVAEVQAAGADEAHRTALSLVLLLDQMTRNTLRTRQALVYSHYDRIARSLARQLLFAPELAERRPHRHPEFENKTTYTTWFPLPFEHSEFIEDHDIFDEFWVPVKAYYEETKNEEGLKQTESQTDFANRHRVIIEKFGRYPYRNRCLGRETTEEEKKWIEDGGDTFGASA